MSNSCCIFGLTKGREKEILMFRFPSNETKCQSWLAAFDWKKVIHITALLLWRQ